MTERVQVRRARRLVIKIGSALLTNDGRGLDVPALAGWVDQIAELVRHGVEVVVVSSGSVAEGMTRLGWSQRRRCGWSNGPGANLGGPVPSP